MTASTSPASVIALRPRRSRDYERGRREAAAVKAAGHSAMDQALAQIDGAFNHAARLNDFKMRVEWYIRHGADHPAVMARYGALAKVLGGDNGGAIGVAHGPRAIDIAIAAIERWHRAERTAFQIAGAIGRGSRLSLDVLAELRLILRLLRFTGRAADFPRVLAIVAANPVGNCSIALTDRGRRLAAAISCPRPTQPAAIRPGRGGPHDL